MKEEIKQVEANGYCKIPQFYAKSETDKALELVLEWEKKTEGALADNIPFLNRDQSMVYNLQNKDFYFLILFLGSKKLEKLLMHFLNDIWHKTIPLKHPNYILRSLLARSSNKALPLHLDSFIPYIGSHVIAMQCMIVLEDMKESNGCTLVIPGSHQSGEYVQQSSLKDAVSIEASSGDVVIWDSRLWHGATENNSGKTRWAITATFTRWWLKQAFNITQNLPQGIYERLTDNQKAILGFCAIPYNDESEGVDMRQGYDSLLRDVSGYRL